MWGSMAKGSLVEGASCAKARRWHVSGMFEEHRGALSVGPKHGGQGEKLGEKRVRKG